MKSLLEDLSDAGFPVSPVVARLPAIIVSNYQLRAGPRLRSIGDV